MDIEPLDHRADLTRIEEGEGLVQMGDTKDRLDFKEAAREGDAIMVGGGPGKAGHAL